MLDMFEKKPRLSKLRISYIGALVAAVACLGGYVWHVYALFRDAQQTTPQPQIERLSRDLRTYHSQMRQFPANFPEINERLWRTRLTPDYGSDGRRARTKNYVYLYRKVTDETCAFWAPALAAAGNPSAGSPLRLVAFLHRAGRSCAGSLPTD